MRVIFMSAPCTALRCCTTWQSTSRSDILEHTTDLLGVVGAGVDIGVGGGGGEGGGLEAVLPLEGGCDGVARACGRDAGGGGLPASASAL